MPEKVCCRCRISRPLEAFGRDKHAPTGLSYKCRECARVEAREYRVKNIEALRASWEKYRRENKDNVKQAQARYYAKHREFRLATNAAWRKQNAERRAEYHGQYQEANRDLCRKRSSEWAKKNATRCRARCEARRARKMRAFVEHVTVEALLERDGPECRWCGSVLPIKKLTEDHVTPLSRGGKHSMANCALACQRCNSSKGAKLPMIYLMDKK
jgi:5-methylcytosine-specific restriction endonuclease McrA